MRVHFPRPDIRWPTALLVLATSVASAQEFACANVRTAQSLAPKYSRVANTNLCEGFYDKNISQPLAEVVSVLLHPRSNLEWPGNAVVQVTTPLTRKTATELRIQPLRISDLYRVDARFVNSLSWKSTQLRNAIQLQMNELGLLGTIRVQHSGEVTIAPVAAIQVEVPADPVAYVTVRVSALTTDIRFRYWTRSTGAPADLAWAKAISKPKYPWTWATFSVPMIGRKTTDLDITTQGDKAELLDSIHIVLAGEDYDPG